MLRHKNILSLMTNYHAYRQIGLLGQSPQILVQSDSFLKLTRCFVKRSSHEDSSTVWTRAPTSTAYKPSLNNRNLSKRVTPQQCPPPKPQRNCTEEEDAAARAKRNNKLILGAILLSAGSFYTLWKLGAFSDDEQEAKQTAPTTVKSVIGRIPAASAEIPSSVPYLLIGGGTASFSAFRSIKSLDPKAKVLVIGDEKQLPYMRPPLSKEIWFNPDSEKAKELVFKQWNGAERSLLYEPEDFYISCKDLSENENGGVAVARGWKVSKIDPFNRIAYLDDGHEIKYEKCLLATGARPKNLELFEKASLEVKKCVMLYRGVSDFVGLSDSLKKGESVAIIGGGFLGSELACALARKAKTENLSISVNQIFKEAGNMYKVLPAYLSQWTTKRVSDEGVNVIAESEVRDVVPSKNGVSLMLNNNKTVTVNKVIVAVGVEPNTELAESSKLETESDLGGYLVNAELEARSHLYAAGDCSCFYDVKFGRRRVEHHDHAVISGRLAGENMVGSKQGKSGKPYLHQSMFWSDLGPEVGYEAIGVVDSSLPTVGVFAKGTDLESSKTAVIESGEKTSSVSGTTDATSPSESTKTDDYGRGVIFYLRDGFVVGIVLWNLYARMAIARQVLKDDRKFDDLNEVAKLFSIFEE